MAIAVITGTASGIGAAAKQSFEARGDTVISVDVQEGAEIVADLATAAGRERAIADILQRSGGQIDYLVLCAGYSGLGRNPDFVLELNWYGTVDLLNGLFEALQQGTDPCAVIVSSNSSQFLQEEQMPVVNALVEGDMTRFQRLMEDQDGGMMYAFTKNAIVRDMRRRAAEWGAAGVRIVAIAPGPTLTPMVKSLLEDPEMAAVVNAVPMPLGRMGEPEEMGDCIAMLCSKVARYIHASVLWVDGGTDAAIRPDSF